MEQDPPVLPVAWEKINDVWYNYVKGHNPKDYFGIYDCRAARHVLAGQGVARPAAALRVRTGVYRFVSVAAASARCAGIGGRSRLMPTHRAGTAHTAQPAA